MGHSRPERMQQIPVWPQVLLDHFRREQAALAGPPSTLAVLNLVGPRFDGPARAGPLCSAAAPFLSWQLLRCDGLARAMSAGGPGQSRVTGFNARILCPKTPRCLPSFPGEQALTLCAITLEPPQSATF